MRRFGVAGIALAAVVAMGAGKQGSARPVEHTLRLVKTIDLPGPAGKRFDYLIVDLESHLLFSSHLGAGVINVIDTRTDRVIKTIPDTPGVEGVMPAPDLDKLYASDWFENKIAVVDLHTLRVIKKILTAAKPDGIAYAAPFHKIYVSDERGRVEAVIDARRDVQIKMIHFPSETGMPQYDPVARKVYVNLEDTNRFAVIDPATDTVAAEYLVGRCQGNHGMALDPEHHRAFLSCEENHLMTVFDLDRHVPIAYLPEARGADVVQFDAGLGRIYVACYSGAISAFREETPDRYRKIEDFPVPYAVHSIAIDPATHRVYAPEQQLDGKPASKLAIYEAVTAAASD
ncbi:MAG: YncE family protein [Acidobacteriota bacterium]|nr:YncE family protein [Acidobacteriota bacterium]